MKKVFLLALLIVAPLLATAQFAPWKAGAIVSQQAVSSYGVKKCFAATPIPDDVWARMQGKSYAAGCPIPRTELRYVRLLHVDAEGNTRLGEMICNKAIAKKVVCIFRKLYENKYPIECVRLIDDFDANDEKSMTANNTSCFCYRPVNGTTKLSNHAKGLAVDINPLYNPCVRTKNGKQTVEPAAGEPYADRNKDFTYKLKRGDLAHSLFMKAGFMWGGDWQSLKDWQHFEKP